MKVWSMFCKHCGQAFERGHKFCGNCGAAIPQEQFESEVVITQAAATGTSGSGDATPATTAASTPATPKSEASQLVPSSSSTFRAERRRRGELPSLYPVEKQPCPRCKKLIRKEDRVCEWCGRELRRAATQEPQAVNGLSFAGYADTKTETKQEAVIAPPVRMQRRVVRRRRSPAPVLEILVVLLLLGGAATAVWIMRSSLPAGSAAGGGVKVTVTPASARVAKGKTVDILATVSGSENVEVNWSIQEGDEGGHVESRGAKAAKGKVWSQAVYTAPKAPGTYHLAAESKADSDKSAVVVITVVNR